MKLFSFFPQSAILSIIPTSQRSVNTSARALAPRLAPLLEPQLDSVMSKLGDIFPASLNKECSLANVGKSNQEQPGLALTKIGPFPLQCWQMILGQNGFRSAIPDWCLSDGFFFFFTPLALELLIVGFCFTEYFVLCDMIRFFFFTSLL